MRPFLSPGPLLLTQHESQPRRNHDRQGVDAPRENVSEERTSSEPRATFPPSQGHTCAVYQPTPSAPDRCTMQTAPPTCTPSYTATGTVTLLALWTGPHGWTCTENAFCRTFPEMVLSTTVSAERSSRTFSSVTARIQSQREDARKDGCHTDRDPWQKNVQDNSIVAMNWPKITWLVNFRPEP